MLGTKGVIFAVAVAMASLSTPANAEADDSFLQLAPHPFTGRCSWRSVNSSDQGIEATLFGYAVVGDGMGAGVTIRCWLRYTDAAGGVVPNTTTQNGLPGSVAVTVRQVVVPMHRPTTVCAFAQALFITPDDPQSYRTPGC